MKALTWKAVSSALNSSPVFAAIAMFTEGLAMTDDESRSKEIGVANDCALPRRNRQMSMHTREHVALASEL
jgi:hypothetical protein